jgi:hypothetical protein
MVNNKYEDKKGRYEINTVEIEDIDSSVFDYFDKKLALTVDGTDGRRKVPVVYATGERWKLIRKSNFRDEHGTVILPLMSINRINIDKTPGFGGLGQQVDSITISNRVHDKTANLQNLLSQRKFNNFPEIKKDVVVRDYLTIPFPKFITVFYEVTVWAQYQTQMNEIMEKIFYNQDFRTDSFVIPLSYDGKKPAKDGYYFTAFREGMVTPETNFKEFTDQERIVKYIFTIKVAAYLILNPKDETLSYGKDEDKKVVYKTQSSIGISLKEQVISLEDFIKKFG